MWTFEVFKGLFILKQYVLSQQIFEPRLKPSNTKLFI